MSVIPGVFISKACIEIKAVLSCSLSDRECVQNIFDLHILIYHCLQLFFVFRAVKQRLFLLAQPYRAIAVPQSTFSVFIPALQQVQCVARIVRLRKIVPQRILLLGCYFTRTLNVTVFTADAL